MTSVTISQCRFTIQTVLSGKYRFNVGLPAKAILWKSAIDARLEESKALRIDIRGERKYSDSFEYFWGWMTQDFPYCSEFHVPIDESIVAEDRDFLDEAIVLLHEIQKLQHNDRNPVGRDEWKYYLDDYKDADKKHLLLYNWLALSLIRAEKRDVAAIAVYQLADKYRIFYTKNSLNEEDIAHANQLCDLVRNAATNRTKLLNLQMMYCDLIFKNCFNKIDKRLDQLRRSMSDKMESRIGDRKINAIDHLKQKLLTLEKQLIGDDDLPFVLGNADTEAMKQTGAKNLYEALRLHACSVKEESKSSLNASSFASLSAHCWVLGKSQLLESLASAGQINNKLMLALSKFGEYFRGVTKLHKAIEMPSAVTLFQNMELIPVTSEPMRKIDLDSNFLYVLEVIYYNCTGLYLPVRREQIIKKYGPAIKNYRDLTKSYVRHAEVSLINHIESLKPNKLAPTKIGISRLCCRLCAIYIDTINSQKLLKKWQISGSHGSIYLWQRDPIPHPKFAAAENAVKEYVYTELVNIINSLLDSVSESPTAPVRYVDELEEVGSTAFKLV